MVHIARVTRPQLVISGGQTGVDRAALDWAIDHRIPQDGYCPAGRRAEDGIIPLRYRLEELPSRDYRARTRKNVEAAEATLILARGSLSGGALETARIAKRLGKALHVVDLSRKDLDKAVIETNVWLSYTVMEALNVAGPRESTSPGIYKQSREFLEMLRVPYY